LAAVAEESLDIQYYIWHNDASGRRLAGELLRAADRGVRIRLLLDDLGSSASDQSLILLNQHPNIEVRLFNPIINRGAKMLGMLRDFGRTNHRMHNKAFIADSQAVIVGGRNIGDEYFSASEEMNFADFDVVAIGSVVGEMSKSFDEFWNSPLSITISELAPQKPNAEKMAEMRAVFETKVKTDGVDARLESTRRTLADEFRTGRMKFTAARATAVYDAPSKVGDSKWEKTNLASQVRPTLMNAKRRVVLVSPYFVPGQRGVETLGKLVASGVDVILLTNSLASNDVPAVHSGYQRYREPLLRSGVRLHEFKAVQPQAAVDTSLFTTSKAGLHAKTFVFDDQTFFVGSMNLDPRSIRWNTEIGIIVESPELAAELTQRLLKVIDTQAYRVELEEGRLVWTTSENGQPVVFETEPHTTRAQRFKIWLLSCLPLEKQI
jgi:putative cardiolipin synthase